MVMPIFPPPSQQPHQKVNATRPPLQSSISLPLLYTGPTRRTSQDRLSFNRLRHRLSASMNVSAEHAVPPPALPSIVHGRPIGPRRVSNAAPPLPQQQQPLQHHANPQENGSAGPVDATMPPPVAGQMKPPVPINPGMVQPPGLPAGAGPQFEGSRSPPGSKSKDLSHVPCKFFKVGTCQAGKACPFSHSLEMSSDAPCKYFQKGNCKFGGKCALAHILPDGRRINHNRPHNGGGLQLGGRINPEQYTNHRSALHNSLMQQNVQNQYQQQHLPHQQQQHQFMNQEEFPALPGHHQDMNAGIYGSPGAEQHPIVGSLAASQRTLGPLDATLPASLDSNGLSHFARHGPFASSVPSKFGLDSPPMSVPSERGGALRSLYMSAFGDEDSQSNSPVARSPQLGEDAFGARFMHSSKRALRPGIMSSSFPTVMGGWPGIVPDAVDDNEIDSVFEEDYIPGSLQELLTDKEKIRRFSRTEDDGNRRSAFGSYAEQQPIGSPPMGSSPRFGPLFSRNKREDDPISGLGHVGSPLRNSYINEVSPLGRAGNRDSAELSFSPPRAGGMSALTQQLGRTRLSSKENIYAQDISASSSPIVGPQTGVATKKPDTPTATKPSALDDETQFLMEEDEELSSGPPKGRGLGLGVSPWGGLSGVQ